MKPLFDDTHPRIEQMLIEGYRRMTTAQKLERIWEMNRFVYHIALAEVKSRYPDRTEREWRLRVASRYLPADLMRKAFNWDPDTEGY